MLCSHVMELVQLAGMEGMVTMSPELVSGVGFAFEEEPEFEDEFPLEGCWGGGA